MQEISELCSYLTSGVCLYAVLSTVLAGIAYFFIWRKGKGGYDGFADKTQLSQYTKKDPHNHPDTFTVLSVTEVLGKGGTLRKKATLYIPGVIRDRHMLVVGKSGSGLISRVIFPILFNDIFDPDRTVVVFDSTGEMWNNLANLCHRHAPEKKIIRFNPLHAEKSMSWNFVSHLKDESECGRMSRTIFSVTEGKCDDSSSETMTALSLLQAILLGFVQDIDTDVSIPKVHQLLQGGTEAVCSWIESRPESARIASSFLKHSAQSPSQAAQVLAELLMRLHLWDNSSVRAVTEKHEIDPSVLASAPTLCIIELEDPSFNSLHPLASLLFCELYRGLMAYSESSEGQFIPKPFGIVCGEFGSAFECIPDLSEKLAGFATRSVSVLAAITSIEELRLCYKEHCQLVTGSFHTKLILPPLDSENAEWAAKEIGYTANSESLKTSYPEPAEFMAGREHRTTFLLPYIPPFQANLTPFFKNEAMIEKFHTCKMEPELNVRDV